MTPFSLDAYAALAELVQGIRATPEGLSHPVLGRVLIHGVVREDQRHALVMLTYGNLSWSRDQGALVCETQPLVTLSCGIPDMEAAWAGNLQQKLDFVQQEFRAQASPVAMAYLHAVLQLGTLRFWNLFLDPEAGRGLRGTAFIDNTACLRFRKIAAAPFFLHIPSGRMLQEHEHHDLPRIPNAIMIQEDPLCAIPLVRFAVMTQTDDGDTDFPEGLEPVLMSGHARMAMLDGILSGYRGAGQPDPDFTGL